MDDFDITAFAKMFDAALASDNPAVRKALRNFMMIAAITESENNSSVVGPFGSLLSRMDDMEQELQAIKYVQTSTYPSTTIYPGGLIPPSYPGTYTSFNGGGSRSASTTDSTSNNLSELSIDEMLCDLKTDEYWSDSDVSSLTKAFKDFDAK
jgi:hypothetical protein